MKKALSFFLMALICLVSVFAQGGSEKSEVYYLNYKAVAADIYTDEVAPAFEEETGISINIEPGPFMVIEEYYSNYLETGNTRCNKMYYYIVHSNEGPKVEEMSLSELEQKTDFNLFYIPIKDMEVFLQESIKNNSIEEVIGEEMLTVMKEYQEKYRRR